MLTLEEIQEKHKDVTVFHRNYINKLASYADKNFSLHNLELGDHVILKKDFDNNVKTKKNAFDGFYFDDKYEIISYSQHCDSQLKIKNIRDGTVLEVSKTQLKRSIWKNLFENFVLNFYFLKFFQIAPRTRKFL
ncbi:hypothetical protein ENBRE01_3086 [Enteropsectra breve]|nr:hypothetical protein ENBRE01_3086 [Enteropsectra breve]